MKDIKFRLFGKNSGEFLRPENAGLNLKELQNVCDIDLWHVMQFTGMKDKNGVEIYEGDRLIFNVRKDNQVIGSQAFYGEQGVAELTPSGTCFGGWDAVYCTDRVVVGNIYQNPKGGDS